MDHFQGKLMLGETPIQQIDKNGIPLHQFDEVRYKEEKYIIIWHPIYDEFVASHCTGECIPFNVLNRVKLIKNSKDSYLNEKKSNV
ncbi:hypothetical protein M3Y14_27620 [Bacillus thuringiensis]|nr:hypothetical protein M3Y14_27620 [Bacillus thuringiensis]